MADNDFIIKISTPGAEQAKNTISNLSAKLLELTEITKNVGSGSKEFNTLGKEFSNVAKMYKSYAGVIEDVNKKNSNAFVLEQKMATAYNKNAISLANLASAKDKAAMAASRKRIQDEREAIFLAKNLGEYTKLNNELRNYELKMKNAIAAGKLNDTALAAMATKYNNLRNSLENVNTKFKELTKTTEQTRESGMAFASFMGNTLADYVQRAISSVGEFRREISEAGVMLDGVANTFAAGARGWRQGGDEMEWVAQTAKTLGLNLKSTYEPYAKFMTSFTRSGGTLQESRQIFEDLSAAMVALHLNSYQMENIFIALEQMANKGTVQSEELKRQLGNALPGAFELAAQSMNVTTAELMDMMKAGEVASREFLPKFAALVKDSLGKQVGIAVNQYNAQLNRLQSQTFLFQANIGQLWNNASVPLIKFRTSALEVVNDVSKGFKDSATAITVLQTAMIAFSAASVVFISKFKIVNQSMVLLGANIKDTTKALWAFAKNPVGLALIAISSAALYCYNSLNKVNRVLQEQSVQQRDVTNRVTGLVSEYTQLANISNRTKSQQEAYNRTLESLKIEYPSILDYVQKHGINLKNLTEEQARNIAYLAVQQEEANALKTKVDTLNNAWSIFGTRAKQAAGVAVGGLQAVGIGIGHVLIAVGQFFAKTTALAEKALGEITEKAAFVASKVGAKETAVNLDNITKSLKQQANISWNFGAAEHEALNKSLEKTAQWIKNMEVERKTKAIETYKDTIATLGVEQAKLAQQLMYSSEALSYFSNGGDSKGGKSSSGKSANSQTQWDALNKEISSLEELIKVRKLNGQSIDDLEPKYVRLKTLQDQINKSVSKLNEAPKTGLEALKEKAKEAAETYEKMIGNANAFTLAEIRNAAATMKQYDAEVKYYEVLKKRESILQIGNREAKAMAENLIDTIFDPLEEGETLWTRFKDAGISALKAIATTWTKNIMNSMLTGFQTNWGKYSKLGLGERLGASMRGAMTGLFKLPLTGTKDAQIDPTKGWVEGIKKAFNVLKGNTSSSAVGTSFLDNLTNKAKGLTSVLFNNTNPAVNAAKTAISSVANPAIQAASSIGSMAVSAPIAAVGMGAMGAIMAVLAPAAVSAAPALTTMATAMAAISASAANAATSMAAFAVSAASASVAQIPFIGGFLAPVAALATGAAIAAGTAMVGAGIGAGAVIAGGGQMVGGALSGIGSKLSGASSASKVIPHAKGGIVSSPTMFPMAGGNIGLAGEAGTEIIAPAKRMSNGDLGIGAVQPQVTVNNYTNAAVEVKRRPDNSTEIKIMELNSMLSSSRTNKGMASAQYRMQKSGRQIG